MAETEKDPAAVSLGRKGGKAGKGASTKRNPAFHPKQGKAHAEKRWAKVRAEKAAEPTPVLASDLWPEGSPKVKTLRRR